MRIKLTPEQVLVLRAAAQEPLIASDLIIKFVGDLGTVTPHGIRVARSLIVRGLLEFTQEAWVRDSARWYITPKGRAVLSAIDSGGPDPTPGGGGAQFRPIDRLILWTVGKMKSFHLRSALEQFEVSRISTYTGVVFAVEKCLRVGMIKKTGERRGWFIGELTERGREMFRQQFPGEEPK